MRKNKNGFRLVAALLVLVLAVGLAACGGEKTPADPLESMKEFSSVNGAVSMYMDKEWITQDAELEYWLLAGNEKDTLAAMVMQCPKKLFSNAASDFDGFKDYIRQSYNVKNEVQETEQPTVEGMTGVSAETCEITAEDGTAYTYLSYAESDYAWYAIVFMSDKKLTDKAKASFRASVGTLKETVPEVESNLSTDMTDTIRWFNAAYAVLTDLNGHDYNLFGGMEITDTNKQIMQASLEEWWGVTDKESADDNMDWLLSEGHRVDFAENMEILKEDGLDEIEEAERAAYLVEYYSLEEDEAAFYASAYDNYNKYGETAIDGWDYCRALSLLGWYYIAGYYDEAEALDKSLEVAQTLQEEFGSWDELMDSYLRGYEYWSVADSTQRRERYEEIKARGDSPYNLDWNLALEKTW